MNVTVWNEYSDYQKSGKTKEIYPDGIHNEIASFLRQTGIKARTAVLDENEDGLTDEILNNTDVLIWWGHRLHDSVSDRTVERIVQRVYMGMGIIFLHSAHMSKPFKRLMGTSCTLKYREADESERLWTVNPIHPIAKDVGEYIELEKEEMYGEFFDIPKPEELVFIGWFKGGEIFRSGVTYTRGYGKIFYFQPGHETYPIYKNTAIQKIIINAVNWAVPKTIFPLPECKNSKPLEKL